MWRKGFGEGLAAPYFGNESDNATVDIICPQRVVAFSVISPRFNIVPTTSSPAPSLLTRPAVRWGLLILFWNVVGLAFLARYYIVTLNGDIEFEWRIAMWTVVGWYVWIPLTPFTAWLARRFPVEQQRWLRRSFLHLVFAILICAAEIALYTGLRMVIYGISGTDFDPIQHYNRSFLSTIFFDILFYSCIIAVVHALDTERKFRARAVRLAQVETQLVGAQLRALRMQLNPHFLFNTLHTISAIMDENVKTARRLMVDLSDLLRLSLDHSGQLVPLRQELSFLQRYLGIEQERLQERLRVHMDVEVACNEAMVPHLILQPLVENAIKHGIAPYARGGEIYIRARCQAETLVLEVADDGPGIPEPSGDGAAYVEPHAERTGIGLRTTQERLEHLFGDEARFELINQSDSGLLVRLTLPFYTEVFESVSA